MYRLARVFAIVSVWCVSSAAVAQPQAAHVYENWQQKAVETQQKDKAVDYQEIRRRVGLAISKMTEMAEASRERGGRRALKIKAVPLSQARLSPQALATLDAIAQGKSTAPIIGSSGRRRQIYSTDKAATTNRQAASRTYDEPQKVARYEQYGREVAQIVQKMNGVTVGRTEKDDLRALAYLLRGYNGAVAARNWRQADSIAERMHVYLSRGSAVAADAERRKAAWARAEAEQRHRQEMEQRERHHQEQMRLEREQQQQQWQQQQWQQRQQRQQQQDFLWWWHHHR